MQKIILLLLATSFLSMKTPSKLPHRCIGVYKGTTTGYDLKVGDQTTAIQPTEVTLKITETNAVFSIQGAVFEAPYKIKSVKKGNIDLTILFETLVGYLDVHLIKKGKKLIMEKQVQNIELALVKKKKHATK